MRFGRLRDEKRNHYVKKIAEVSFNHFTKTTYKGLILAGSADFKDDLLLSNFFDKKLKEKVINVVTTSHGGERGFHEAISLAADSLNNVSILDETNVLKKFFYEVQTNSSKYCIGVKETMEAFEIGAIDTIIVFENLKALRFALKSDSSDKKKIIYLDPDEEKNDDDFYDEGVKMNINEKVNLTEWLIDNYQTKGAQLKFVTRTTPEGSNFVELGGIGGILRYDLDLSYMAEDLDKNEFAKDQF